MAKNIIVCADGTGNKGGSTPDSNVYKIYKAIDKHVDKNNPEQIIFYDNGVGTEKNKYLRALGGGLGIGFEDNVCDLYRFLARNYELGDRIYFFGFSRGASTVRACNGFIRKCGLLKGYGKRHEELEVLVKEAFAAYKVHKKTPELAEKLRTSDENSHGAVPIHFMGVWDTVVALGFPSGTDETGWLTRTLNTVFAKAGRRLDRKWWPHKFYDYKLTGNVINAYQALALDDERTAFKPFVWNENLSEEEMGVLENEDGPPIERRVEQVWFAGMHSNVGGGYPRSGLASVSLYWMMLRAEKCGLRFEGSAMQQTLDDRHVHGRMYDSREGAAMAYRYHPREIEELCKVKVNDETESRLKGEIKIHHSVIERMNHRTGNYAPGHLPGTFEVAEDALDAAPVPRNPEKHEKWSDTRSRIDRWVLERKRLYERVLAFLLATLLVGGVLWFFVGEAERLEGVRAYFADILDYFVPGFLENLVHIIVFEQPWILIAPALLVRHYIKLRNKYRKNTMAAREDLRHWIIEEGAGLSSSDKQ